MKKMFFISLITLLFLSCKSTQSSPHIMGSWERIIQDEHPSNKGYKEITTFSSPNIITITEIVNEHGIRHSGIFTVTDDDLVVHINEKTYEGTYSIINGILTIHGNDRIYKYKKVSK
ncbi:hypothetical protein PQO03_02525 [Lentisphaera profundi]|uniref:DUF5640 domain-containing protein n=1 Tax=Lentisphaera profundi TaxID=1658616 RepID=A0ABY7VUE4_9BACT|nr:hypothetical protein [Lentisphaera profundi]WDE96835.1 hypothetical protein PQO03_02525 [Lentisphaera profundi]